MVQSLKRVVYGVKSGVIHSLRPHFERFKQGRNGGFLPGAAQPQENGPSGGQAGAARKVPEGVGD
jgi:hypothetical protein